jgi:hypothetical protein
MRLGQSFGALRERNFRLLWIGQATSAFGDRMAPIALAFAVLNLTGSAKDLGYVLAAQVDGPNESPARDASGPAPRSTVESARQPAEAEKPPAGSC